MGRRVHEQENDDNTATGQKAARISNKIASQFIIYKAVGLGCGARPEGRFFMDGPVGEGAPEKRTMTRLPQDTAASIA